MSWISNFTEQEREQTHFVALPVDPALQEYVRYYWAIKCGPATLVTPELLAPDGLDEIIFSYDSHFVRDVVPHGHSASFNTNGYIIGSKKYGLLCTRISALSMIGIKLQAGALHKIFNLPMNELRENPVSLESLNVEVVNTLENKLYEAKSLNEIKHLLDAHLMKLLGEIPPPTISDSAVKLLTLLNGNCTVSALAEKLNVGVRNLQKQFDTCIGISPKALAGVLRFKKLYHNLNDAHERGLDTNPLCDLGFYDQSHFIKDFQKYINISPQKLFKAKTELSTKMLNICLSQDRIT